MKLASMLMVLIAASAVQASTIAVIDSGLDYKHDMITPNLWKNDKEVIDYRDNDGNGYQDDLHGWNFAEQNGNIIEYKYLGTFSPDCKKYFDIQGKRFLNQATEAEIAWLKAIVQDKEFIKQMGVFGNFVHGTHVAGITIKDSNNVAMGIKLLPTETKLFLEGLGRQAKSSAVIDRWKLLEQAFTFLAAQQMTLLTDIARFVDYHKADVANGSFGTGFNQAKMITNVAFKVLFFRAPTEEESHRASKLFIDSMVKEGARMIAAAPNTLFVFAAGNDGMNNDIYGTSPANIKGDNVITVGATYKNEFFAPFSNYGTKMVEIAAPGMLIKSAIPGNETLEVSGTSQAAPYIANVAAKIKTANPALKPSEIKSILMGTVDKKAFLAEKVMTSGIVNLNRAVVAAELTKSVTLVEAIARAKSQVKDAPTTGASPSSFSTTTPIPLYPMFN